MHHCLPSIRERSCLERVQQDTQRWQPDAGHIL